MPIHRINPRAAQARRVARVMVRSLHQHMMGQGEHLAGFAIVSWDGRGEVQTSFQTSTGPIGRSMLGPFVGNALTQHVAASLAEESGVIVLPSDDPA